jgi:hypothetical protein
MTAPAWTVTFTVELTPEDDAQDDAEAIAAAFRRARAGDVDSIDTETH